MKYFILKFSEDVECKAYITNFCPVQKPSFQSLVRLRGKGFSGTHPVTVMALHERMTPHAFTTSISKKDVPVYKSNVQKCIRRKMTNNAIRSAYALMSVDPMSLLKRLTVIMIEDVRLHTSFINLVWWMMAISKGYILSDDEISYILGVIYTLCDINIREKGRLFNTPQNIRLNILNPQEAELLQSMQFRCAYGGLSCDIAMFNYFIKTYYDRFRRDTSYETSTYRKLEFPEICPIDLDSVDQCNKRDIILPAIDYHCYPWIVRKLKGKYTEDDVKCAIWIYRSNINDRKFMHPDKNVNQKIPEHIEEVYKNIEKDIDNLSQWILEKIIDKRE